MDIFDINFNMNLYNRAPVRESEIEAYSFIFGLCWLLLNLDENKIPKGVISLIFVHELRKMPRSFTSDP